jgi:hypothetical protein
MTLKEECAAAAPPPNGQFCPEIAAKIIDSIGRGLSPEEAANLWRVNTEIFDEWIDQNTDFAERIEQAKALDIALTLQQMMQAGSHWRSYAWKIERRHSGPGGSDCATGQPEPGDHNYVYDDQNYDPIQHDKDICEAVRRSQAEREKNYPEKYRTNRDPTAHLPLEDDDGPIA